jgi:hypothetical protein
MVFIQFVNAAEIRKEKIWTQPINKCPDITLTYKGGEKYASR